MDASQGILTVRGGMTSHAAVVARGMGTCCVSGCGEIKMRRRSQVLRPWAARPIHEGDWMSLDGSTGNDLRRSASRPRKPRSPAISAAIMALGGCGAHADQSARTPTPRATLRRPSKFGAEGIGLCRTEHMFFEADRITAVREMIVSKTAGRAQDGSCTSCCRISRATLKRMYKAYWKAVRSPCVILDPPLHEFLPTR